MTTIAYRLLACTLLLIATAAAAEEVGTVASATGSTTVGRGDLRTAATVGMPVQLGDTLSTGADGKLRVVFRDDSVIDLGESSSLVVDQQVFNPSAGTFTSLMRLVSGRARSLVSEYYRNPGASYHVETPTAVAGVRGTSFLVAYYPDSEVTEVIGIHGRIEVSSVGTRARESVYINANEATTVPLGEAPSPPETLDEQRFRQQTEGLDQLALGSIGNLAGGGALTAGAEVGAPDKAPSSSGLAGQLGRDQLRNAADVAGQPIPVVEATRGSLGVPF